MDRLDAMVAFVAVAELRGFAPAARRLGLSPSAVTRLVASLEERLSIRLLMRTTRTVTLTDGGARYLERARRILADVVEAEGIARAERTEPTGHLLVAAPQVFGRREVAPLLWDFLSRYPSVSGSLILADRMVNLVEEGVDVAVRIGVLEDSGLVSRQAGETRRVVVGSPAYLDQRGRPRTPGDLRRHAIIQFTSVSPTLEWHFPGSQDQRVPIRPTFVTNSAEAAIGYAERGGGLTMVLAYQVMSAVQGGRLEVVLAAHEPPPLPIQLLHPSMRLAPATVRAFIEMAVTTRAWRFVAL